MKKQHCLTSSQSAGTPAILNAFRGLSLNFQANAGLVGLQRGLCNISFVKHLPENGYKFGQNIDEVLDVHINSHILNPLVSFILILHTQ
jgi:hypothetical protein